MSKLYQSVAENIPKRIYAHTQNQIFNDDIISVINKIITLVVSVFFAGNTI